MLIIVYIWYDYDPHTEGLHICNNVIYTYSLEIKEVIRNNLH